jgi:hypothetical protein
MDVRLSASHLFMARCLRIQRRYGKEKRRLIAVFCGFMRLAQESNKVSVVLCALCASAVKWSSDTGYN